MRLLMLLCILPITLWANTAKEYPFRFQFFGAGAAPLFSTSKYFNNNSVFGQAAIAGGGGYMLSYRVRKKLYVGLVFNMLIYSLDEKATKEKVYNRYKKDNYFTTFSQINDGYTIATLNAEIAYRKNTHVVEIEPFARIGFASMSLLKSIDFTAKQANSNYMVTTSVSQYSTEAFAPSLNAGVRFFKKINKRGGIVASAHYTFSSFRLDISERSYDHLNQDYPRTENKITQAVHAIQYELGFQFRFYKKQKPEPEIEKTP